MKMNSNSKKIKELKENKNTEINLKNSEQINCWPSQFATFVSGFTTFESCTLI